MKKLLKVFIINIILIGTFSVTHAKDLGFGLQIGGGIMIPRESNPVSEDKGFLGNGKYCFAFSPYIEYIYEDFYIGARTGIKYNLFGFNVDVINKDSSDNPKSTFALQCHYVSIPILFQINPVEPLSINLGPELFFKIHHTSSLETKADGGYDKIKDRSYKNFVFGMLLNIEYEIVGINFGVESGMTFTGIDQYKNDDEQKTRKDEFEKNKKDFQSTNLFYLTFKIGYNFGHIIKNE
ncbi:MAG: PorT family protein [Bacteroidetes bacterium]|nr:PorT family protein [Bacteroidota bacterium]